jgi:hypothetical protein
MRQSPWISRRPFATSQQPTWYACDTVQFHLLGSGPVEEEPDMDPPSIWPPTYCLAEDFVSEF